VLLNYCDVGLVVDPSKTGDEQTGVQAANTSLDVMKGSLLSSAENLLSTISDTLTSCALSDNGNNSDKPLLPLSRILHDFTTLEQNICCRKDKNLK
jgi:hypothetical protein